MRPPKARLLSVGFAGALGFLSVAATSCSSSDTILALTITSGTGVTQVSNIMVTITPHSGSTITKTFAPHVMDGGVIVMSFFERLSLPDSADGEATVRADALDASSNSFAAGVTTADIQKGHTVAAQVMLTVGGPPPPDGGAGGEPGAGGQGGEAGAHGAGGEAGTHGGGGAGGEAGTHGGGGAGGIGGEGGKHPGGGKPGGNGGNGGA
jgi:hypothetical protein